MSPRPSPSASWTWSYPGTRVSGCTTYDIDCTVTIGQAGTFPAEWQWYEFHVTGPGRVFILPPSYAPRCQPDNPCLDTYTNAWSYVGVSPNPLPKLDARVVANPRLVGVGAEFTATLTVANTGTVVLSPVQPTGPPTITGDGAARLLSGPDPASVTSLAPGGSATFSYRYEATNEGTAVFRVVVEGQSPIGSATAEAGCTFGGASLQARAGQPRAEGPCQVGAAVTIEPWSISLSPAEPFEGEPPFDEYTLVRLGTDATPPAGHGYPAGGT